jgi:hypothetical protein
VLPLRLISCVKIRQQKLIHEAWLAFGILQSVISFQAVYQTQLTPKSLDTYLNIKYLDVKVYIR